MAVASFKSYLTVTPISYENHRKAIVISLPTMEQLRFGMQILEKQPLSYIVICFALCTISNEP
jgi:hypothetical protein